MLQSTFKQYLKLSKRWYEIQKSKKFGGGKNINIVIGNESADLDSTIGSMIYAYYKFCKIENNSMNLLKNVNEFEQKDIESILNVFVPIIQCDKSDIKSRFESIDLLESHQIEIDDILFQDEFNIDEVIESAKLNVILYDHNCTTYPQFKDKVIEIVDHHKDTTLDFYDKEQQICKNIQIIGSATSLLGEYFMDGNEHLLDAVVADAILKTVVVDSYNFDPKQETIRWNQRDQVVFSYLTKYLNQAYPEKNVDRNQLFQHIEGLKFDNKKNLNLGIPKLLVKDYKQFKYENDTKVGYSVFMISPESLFEAFPAQQLENDITNFIQTKNLDILFLLFAYPTKEYFERKIIVITSQNRLQDLKKIQEQLESKLKINKLDYTQYWNIYKNTHYSFYDPTHTYTRKVIEPLIAEIKFSKSE